MIKQLIEKLQEKDYHERMSLIYMWVKQEYITKTMFIQLIEEVQKDRIERAAMAAYKCV